MGGGLAAQAHARVAGARLGRTHAIHTAAPPCEGGEGVREREGRRLRAAFPSAGSQHREITPFGKDKGDHIDTEWLSFAAGAPADALYEIDGLDKCPLGDDAQPSVVQSPCPSCGCKTIGGLERVPGGSVAKIKRVIMDRDTYPRRWGL